MQSARCAVSNESSSDDPGENLSVVAIEREHGRCRATVDRLTEQREMDKQELTDARRRQRELGERIKFLDQRIQRANQSVFALLPRLEQLDRLRARVAERCNAKVVELRHEAARAPVSSPAAPLATDERRQHKRIPLEVEVSLTSDANFYVGFSNDISSGGLFVVSYEHQHAVGERFCVSFRLPGRAQPIFALVEVAWVRKYHAGEELANGAPGMGLRFVGLAPDDQAAIDAFITRREPLFHPDPDDLG